MFGWFDGFFGEGFMADAAEMALEMCLLDELEEDLYEGKYDRPCCDDEDYD